LNLSHNRNQVAKDFDSAAADSLVISAPTASVLSWRMTMNKRTCAACERPFDDTAIRVDNGGKPAEVRCTECALALNKAGADALPEG
jgi:hypothetical protein